MKQNQFEFKPFDQVLVRDYNNDPWRAMHYSHFDEMQKHYCGSSYWVQCIPYNENTAHLLGTNQPYKEPEPKVWHVQGGDTDGISLFSGYCSDSELENFLKNDLLQKKYKWVRIECNQ